MSWNSLDSEKTFRLVFTDYQEAQPYDFATIIKDMINWRNAQNLSKPELYVIKIGYSNFLDYYSLDLIHDFFTKNYYLFQGKPVRFSIYQNINDSINNQKIIDYDRMAQHLQQYNIHCTIAWVFDFKTIENVNIIYDFASELKDNRENYIYLHHVALFHNTGFLKESSYKILNNAVKILEHTKTIDGYDLTSHLNNFYQHNKSHLIDNNLLSVAKSLIDSNANIGEKVVPEIKNLLQKNFTNGQNFSEQVAEFCQNGYIINIKDNTISPLVYGSTDDFSFNCSLNVYEFLLMVYSEAYGYFDRHLTKIFLKSYCSGCEKLNSCQQQKIYWLNLPYNKKCYLKIEQLVD